MQDVAVHIKTAAKSTSATLMLIRGSPADLERPIMALVLTIGGR